MSHSIEAEVLGFDPITMMHVDSNRGGLIAGPTVSEMLQKAKELPKGSIADHLGAMRRSNIVVDGRFAASEGFNGEVVFREVFGRGGISGHKAVAGLIISVDTNGVKSFSSYHKRGLELSNRFSAVIKGDTMLLHGADHNGRTFSLNYRLSDGRIKTVYLNIPFSNPHESQPLTEEYGESCNSPEIQGVIGNIPVGMKFSPRLDVEGMLSHLVPHSTRENPLTTPFTLISDRWAFVDNMTEWGIEIE